MKVYFRKCLVLGLLTSLTLFASTGFAQTDQERSAARETAKDGILEFHQGNFSEAVRLLEAAERVVHAPTHLLFIARSQVKLGKLVEARESYLKMINEQLPDNASRAFQQAQESAREELAELTARVPKLKITLVGPEGGAVKDPEVKIDDQAISSSLVGLSVPVNPGARIVKASAPGFDEAQAEVTLAEGATEEVTLTLSPSSAAQASSAGATGSDDSVSADSPPAGRGRRTIGWVTMGSGVALLGGGAVLGVLSQGQLKDARADDALCSDNTCTESGWTEVDQAKTKALVADIAMGVGIAAVGVGVYLLVTGKKASDETATTLRHLAPFADRNGGYVTLRGAF